MEALGADPPGYREAMELMNPSGQSSHRKGAVFLFLYGWERGVKYKMLGQPDPVSLAWPELLDLVWDIYGAGAPGGAWRDPCGEAAGEEEDAPEGKAAPPQHGAGMPEDAPVDKAGGAPATVPRDAPGAEGAPLAAGMEDSLAAAVERAGGHAGEEQLPGQMDVYDYPELLPGERMGSDGTDSGKGGTDNGKGGTGSRKNGTDGGMAGDGSPADGTDSGTGGTIPAIQEAGGVQCPHEGAGTPEDGGCTGDPGEGPWMEARNAEGQLRQFLAVWDGKDVPRDILLSAYRTAIGLAAALEGMLMGRGWDG
ncbi:MAG: hypothetical protein NC548_02065 [Lachnospiraceae bacterium]|nr:hypothetical protein [Lachnospiraceae bacterium]